MFKRFAPILMMIPFLILLFCLVTPGHSAEAKKDVKPAVEEPAISGLKSLDATSKYVGWMNPEPNQPGMRAYVFAFKINDNIPKALKSLNEINEALIITQTGNNHIMYVYVNPLLGWERKKNIIDRTIIDTCKKYYAKEIKEFESEK